MTKFGKKLRQRKIKEWEEHYINYKALKHFIKENNNPNNQNALKNEELSKKFDELLEEELKKIYRFFVTQERELYLQINTRLHVRKRYRKFTLVQLKKELQELKTLSTYATSLSCYIYLNMTGMAKIMKKFEKKFKRYNFRFTKNFVIEKYQKKNSDLLYIHQYKILDEVGACVEQLSKELTDQYETLMRNKVGIEELNKEKNTDENINIINDGLLDNNQNNEQISKNSLDKIKDDFNDLNNSIGNMEAFYHSISLIFEVWMRYIKTNEYKSHIYSVQGNKVQEENNLVEDEEGGVVEKPKHFLSLESYRNIRIILVQAFLMSLCSTYIYPTVFYFLVAFDNFSKAQEVDIKRIRQGLLCGLIISMIPFGALISMSYSFCLVKKSYKILMILSSVLSALGNSIFLLGIHEASLFFLSFGALIIGFSLNTVVHRRYLLYFIPKRKLNKYLLYFKLTLLTGNSAGPLLSWFCLLFFGNYYESNKNFNEYSLPAWLTFFASLVLLIIIIILFSEPLRTGFEVYAKGQSPTDTIKRSDSFTLDDSLTIYESEKLNEINQRVSVFNDENQFDDTNLVAKTINDLVDKQLERHGTVRKAFWVILLYQFILNFTNMLYITMAPSYFYLNFDNEGEIPIYNDTSLYRTKIICLLYFASLFLFVPSFCLNFFYISMRIDKILYIKILALVLFLVELLTTSFVIQQYPVLFYFTFLLTILSTYVMQDQLNYFYTTIIPSDFRLLGISGLTSIYCIRYIGNFLGSISSLYGILFSYDEKEDLGYFFIIQNAVSILIQFVILVLFFINGNNFADRPIRRIIYSKNIREIRRTEL
jgi:hypothetical protein